MFNKMIEIKKFILLLGCFAFIIFLCPVKAEAAQTSRISRQTFSADHNLTGTNNTFYEYFSTGNWEIDGLQLEIQLETTQLLSDYAPEFTVSVNNEPVYTQVLSHDQDGSQNGMYTISIDCPASCVKTDSTNSISFEVYMRTSSDDACADEQTSSNWINFYKESSINISYKSLNKCDTIASAFDQLSSIDSLENNESAILINGNQSNILSAAARSAGTLYQNAVIDGNNLKMLPYDKALLSKYKTILLFSDYKDLPSEIKSEMSVAASSLAKSNAVAEVIHLDDCNILLVTGSNEKSLESSGLMLSNSDYVQQLISDYTEVKSDALYTTKEPEYQEYIKLSDTETYVNGFYRQSADFYIDWPANRQLSESSEISMSVRYSDNIDYERSLITVYINDTPIGSKKLTKEEADNCQIDFNIPVDVEIDGKFTVTVAFDLEPATDSWCHADPEDSPWAYIASGGMLKLASYDRTDLSFTSYPSPFVRDGIYNNLMIILPKDPKAADFEALGMISCTLGKFIYGNNGDLTVTTSPDNTLIAGCNLIYIGTGQNNYFIKSNPELLSVGYNATNKAFVSSNDISLSPDYGSLVGICQLLVSPFSAEDETHSVMIVSGADDKALLRAASYIGDYDKLYLLSGDTYIADDENAYCYTFLDQKDESISTDLDTVQKTTIISTVLVATLVLLFCVIALSLLIYKYKKDGGPK